MFVVVGVPSSDADSNKVAFKLENGAVYYGEGKNGKPNGKGTMKWGDRKSYSGDWVNGKRSGYGKYIANVNSDGTSISMVYKGYWKNDKYNGQGTFIEVNDYGKDYNVSNVSIGKFRDNLFQEGYKLVKQSELGHFFSYFDNETNIIFFSYEVSGVKNLFKKNFNQTEIHTLSFQKKQNNGLFKGYEYMSAIDGAYSYMTEGSYETKSLDLYTGILYEDDAGVYKVSQYSHGKEKSVKELHGEIDIDFTFDQKIKDHLKDLTPYLNGFAKLLHEL